MNGSKKLEKKKATTLKRLIDPLKRTLLLVPFLCLLAAAHAVPAADTMRKVARDSSKTELRKPDAEKQNDLFEDKDFLFDKVPPAPKTPWERFWDWVERKLDAMFSSEGFGSFWEVFQYVLLGAILLLIIWLVIRNDIRRVFYGKSATADIGFKEVNENIHEIDFNKLIEEAVTQKNYRRAVRLCFLRTLKQLSDKELIRWKTDKTNHDYYNELNGKTMQGGFGNLSLMYEYVWYGDFGLTEEIYKSTEAKFREFNERLKN